MAAWSEMSVARRGGLVIVVAALVGALFYGAWTVRPGARMAAPAVETPAVATEAAAPAADPAAAPAAEAATDAPAADAAEAGAAADAAEAGAAADAAQAGAEADAAQAGAEAAAPVAGAEPVATPEVEAAAPSAPVIVPPVFDLVRVERDGAALVAGTALPAAEISLRVDGAEIVALPADGAGKFVAMFNLPPSVAPRLLGMVMRLADGTEVASTQTVAIAPTTAPAAVVAAADQPESQAGTEAPAAPEQAPAALLVTDEGAKVLQSAEAAPEVALNVTVDAISYTPEGDVLLAGRGTAGAIVRVYLDNAQVGDGLVGADGAWSQTLVAVAPGIYTLRVDQLDATGKVTSRFETPFKRETVEALAAADAAASTEGQAVAAASEGATAEAEPAPKPPVSVTVQPGFTLWRIARETMGEGVMYVQVFEANKDQIRDPDLIYPGQVFTIPQQ